jgi:hypothetical protein
VAEPALQTIEFALKGLQLGDFDREGHAGPIALGFNRFGRLDQRALDGVCFPGQPQGFVTGPAAELFNHGEPYHRPPQ